MATLHWIGDAQSIAQVDQFQVNAGTWLEGDTVTLTINTKTVTYVVAAGGETNDVVAQGLVVAINASTIPEFSEVLAEDTVAALTGSFNITGPSDGTMVKASITGVSAGSTVTGPVSVTAPSGPNWWIAKNFNTRTLPGVGDEVVFRNGNVSCLYGLDDPSVTLLRLSQYSDFTGSIGLPERNILGYLEYRQTFLKPTWGASAQVLLGLGSGVGSSRIKLDMGVGTVDQITVRSTGSSINSSERPVIIGVGQSNPPPLHVTNGDVRVVARKDGVAGELSAVLVGSGANVILDSTISVPAGSHLISGGQLRANSAFNELTIINGGTFISTEDRTFTTLNLFNGMFISSSKGASIGNLNMGSDGVLNVVEALEPVGIVACEVVSGSRIDDPNGVIAWASPFVIKNGTLQSIVYNTVNNVSVDVVAL